MRAILEWLELSLRGTPIALLETWGRFSYLLGCMIAVFAFGGFTLRVGSAWVLARERPAWDTKAFLSMPLTFLIILVSGYLGAAIVLVPGAQTFESLKDLCVFLCIVLFGYPALVTVPFAYGLSDLVEGVPPEFLLDWLPGYFINPSCFWIAYQLFGKDPDFRRGATWLRYALFVVIFMALEPMLWGHICSDVFTPHLSYRSVTPALVFTTGITWVLAPFAMLGALPLARKLGLFWAEIDGHVQERALGHEGWVWEAGKHSAQSTGSAVHAGVPIRMFLFTPFIALVLVMVAATAYGALHSAERSANTLAARLHQEISQNLTLKLDDSLARLGATDRAGLERELTKLLQGLDISKHGRAFIVDRSESVIAPSLSYDAVVDDAIDALRKTAGGVQGLQRPVEFRFDHVTSKPLARETWFARATVYRAQLDRPANWILVTAMPEAFYLAGVRTGNSRSALVFALALLSSLAIAAILASAVSAPLRNIAIAARALAHGDLKHRVPASRLTELDAVAASFNDMTSRLQQSFDALVSEVETRKRRERELEESENRLRISDNRLRSATRAARLAVWDWDVTRDNLIWDDLMYELYGINKSEFSGAYEAWKSCLAQEDVARAQSEVAAALRGDKELATEFKVRHPDGSIHILRSDAQTIRDENGRPLQMVGVNCDVTERYAAEQEIRKHRDHLEELVRERTLALREAKEQADAANRAKSVFLANMSHEIRTPMNAILGFGQLMERQSDLSERDRERLGRIMTSGRHLLTLINNVLEMSKIEAGRATLNAEAFDLPALLASVRGMFADLIASKGIAVDLDVGREVPRAIETDPNKVRQVLINLLGNAAKFTERGSIAIRARSTAVGSDEHTIEIAVTDTGVGIDAAHRDRIFEAFDQSEGGVRKGGTGLGLTISRSFARLMSGDLTVESNPGAGSTFRFSFRARATAMPLTVAEDAPIAIRLPAGAKPKVLIVDDEVVNGELMQDLLSELGFETKVAQDGAEAVQVHARWQPSLILMDLRMPGVDGFEATRRLRAAGSTAFIIAFTASAVAESELEARAAGVDDIVRKPYRERELLIKIADALHLPYTVTPLVERPSKAPRDLAGMVSGLPPELIAQLREATIQARAERIETLSERAAEHSTEAAEQIRTLAHAFQYEALLAALEAGTSHTSGMETQR